MLSLRVYQIIVSSLTRISTALVGPNIHSVFEQSLILNNGVKILK